MTFYGIKFIAEFIEDDFISTQLFTSPRNAEEYAKRVMVCRTYVHYSIIKFQLQQEHVQD